MIGFGHQLNFFPVEPDQQSAIIHQSHANPETDFAARMALGRAGEQALREHFERQGYTVTCPVLNNADKLVRANPGYLVSGGGLSGLDRQFVPLSEADEFVRQGGTPAFHGRTHAVVAPDFRLDKPGESPRLIEAKTRPWVQRTRSFIHHRVLSKSGVIGWRQPYSKSYRLLAEFGLPIEIAALIYGGVPSAQVKRPRRMTTSWGLYTFGPDVLQRLWLPSPFAGSGGAEFLAIRDAKRSSPTVNTRLCERVIELAHEAGFDPFEQRIGSDAFAQRQTH